MGALQQRRRATGRSHQGARRSACALANRRCRGAGCFAIIPAAGGGACARGYAYACAHGGTRLEPAACRHAHEPASAHSVPRAGPHADARAQARAAAEADSGAHACAASAHAYPQPATDGRGDQAACGGNRRHRR